MAEHTTRDGVMVPLLDRLIDNNPDEITELRPLRTFSFHALKESVRKEVERLFNTRSTTSVRGFRTSMQTVIDYGVPDFTAFYPPSQENRKRLQQLLSQALATFEPRLRKVRVHVQMVKEHNVLFIRIDAMLVADSVSEPVSFPVVIRHRDGVIEVHASE